VTTTTLSLKNNGATSTTASNMVFDVDFNAFRRKP